MTRDVWNVSHSRDVSTMLIIAVIVMELFVSPWSRPAKKTSGKLQVMVNDPVNSLRLIIIPIVIIVAPVKFTEWIIRKLHKTSFSVDSENKF